MPEERELTMEQALDLRGEMCPMTLLKTKKALAQMGDGEVLRVTLDHKPAVDDMPAALEFEGHSVLEVKEAEPGLFEIVVRKQGRR